MNYQNRTGSATGAVIAIIVLIVVALGIFYFVSDPFKAKVDKKIEQSTKWTNENIQKDPLGYLTWSMSEVRRVKAQMEANYIGLSRQQKNAYRLKDEATSKQQAAARIIAAGKEAFSKAEAAKSWPASANGKTYNTANEMKADLLKLFKTEQNLSANIEKYSNLLVRLGTNIKRTQEKIDEAKEAEESLKNNIEFVKADQAIKSLDNLRDSVNSVLDVSEILADSSKTLSASDMIEANRSETIDSAAWDKLMSK